MKNGSIQSGKQLALFQEAPQRYQPTAEIREAVVSMVAELLLQALETPVEDQVTASGDGHER